MTFPPDAIIFIRVKRAGDQKRLDVLLTEREIAESRERAQALIMAARVRVNGHAVVKPGTRVPADAEISVTERLLYVSRGGLKLQGALDRFSVSAAGKTCADVGASTGGFTDCLLQRGARRVYAIDVGYGQLAWKLRQDPRVVAMERINIRALRALPEPIDLVTIDVSFISLTLALPVARRMLNSAGQALALIKPQFEASRTQVGKGGIIRDPHVHRAVIAKIARHAIQNDWRVRGICRSPIAGADGNQEFFILLGVDQTLENIDWESDIVFLFEKE